MNRATRRRLSPSLRSAFTRSTVARGEQLVDAERVDLLVVDRSSVVAEVFDAETELVRLDPGVRRRAIEAMCSCDEVDELMPCVHICATLLEIARAEQAGEIPQQAFLRARGLVVAEFVDDGGALAIELDDAFDCRLPPVRPGRATRPTRSNWRPLLGGAIDRVPAPLRRAPDGTRAVFLLPIEQQAVADTCDVVIAFDRDGKRLDARDDAESVAALTEPLALGRVDHLPEPEDRRLLTTLLAVGDVFTLAPPHLGMLVSLANDVVPEMLTMFAEQGRLRALDGRTTGEPLTVDAGRRWQLEFAVRTVDRGALELAPSIVGDDGRRIPADDVRTILPGGTVVTSTSIVAMPGCPAIDRLDGIRIPPDEIDEFLEFAAAASDRGVAFVLPAALGFSVETDRFSPVVQLTVPRLPIATHATATFTPCARYGDRVVACGDGPSVVRENGTRRFHRRDREREWAHADDLRSALAPWHPAQSGSPQSGMRLTLPGRCLHAAAGEVVRRGWPLVVNGQAVRPLTGVGIRVRSGIDWFDLEAEADFEDQRAGLPELLRATDPADGNGLVSLPDGSLGLLGEGAAEHVRRLTALGESADGAVRFTAGQALLLDAHLDGLQGLDGLRSVEVDDAFSRHRDDLRSVGAIEPSDAPPTFQGVLRPYQCLGLAWLRFLARFGLGGCLADDMGLGKTVQVLAQLEARRAARAAGAALDGEDVVSGPRPSLLVVPKSIVGNWIAEAQRFAPELGVLNHTGSQRWAEGAAQFDDHDVVVTTYQTLLRDVERLSAQCWDYLVLDEAQAVKNPRTRSASAVRALSARHRLAVTGTPIENSVSDLWSLLDFLMPGLLGRHAAFHRLFAAGAEAEVNEELRRELAAAIQPFILRRTKEQVAPELPPKLEQTVHCTLGSTERKRYDELRDHLRSSLLGRIGQSGLNRSKMHVLEALLRLRQAACHPALLDGRRKRESSAKLDFLLEQVADVVAEDHKALVFSQFTTLLGVVRDRLDRKGMSYEYLDGSTTDRAARVRRFQEDADCRLFLISLKAGGVGLNLTAADYVFLLDPWWNPAAEAQAIDRTHRIGQDKPVFAYRIVARDTVEERILELQERKRELADAIIRADESLMRRLSLDDLELLLS